MASIDERLAASDPAGASSYAPANFDAMLSRVIATPWRAQDSIWRTFKLRVGGSALAAGLVTGLGVALLGSAGPGLSVLDLASAPAAQGANPTAAAPLHFGTAMVRYVNYQFTGTSALSDQSTSLPVYDLASPSDGAATLSRVSSVLGVDFSTPMTTDGGSTFSAAGPHYSGSLSQSAGLDTWTVTATSPFTGEPAGPSAAVEPTALAWAQALTGSAVGSPVVSSVAAPPGAGSSPETIVVVPITVGGATTSLEFSFIFASQGELVGADGYAFTDSPSGTYPVISPAAGVGDITNQLGLADVLGLNTNAGGVLATGSSGAPGSAMTPVTSLPTTAPVVSPGSPPVTVPSGSSSTTTVPPTAVKLTSVSTTYVPVTLADGTVMLLPIYVYSGTVVASGSSVTFSVLPIEPGYVKLPTYN